jgi:hypothetical protein
MRHLSQTCNFTPLQVATVAGQLGIGPVDIFGQRSRSVTNVFLELGIFIVKNC